ncbi:hypothetical protein M0R45_026000 [Rubus argutus]|uniref:Uncharacterized protein n=1 Tax=Rubus argutus TaxID=59490 RepID=A0AAW1WWA1_RUBAR
MPYGHPEPQAHTIRASLALDLHYPGTTGIPSFKFALTRHPSYVLAPYGHPELRACPNRALELRAHALPASQSLHSL